MNSPGKWDATGRELAMRVVLIDTDQEVISWQVDSV